MNNRIIYFILMIPFFPPGGVIINKSIWRIYLIAKFLIFFIVFFLIVFDSKYSISIGVIFLSAMFGFQMLATYINYGNINKDITTFITSVFFALLVAYGIQRDCHKFLDSTVALIGTLSTINLFTVLFMFEEGLARNEVGSPIYFWATDNHFASLLVIGIVLAFVNNQIHNGKRKKSFLWVTIVATITILKVWSATAVVGWFIVLFGLICLKIMPRIINKVNYLVVIITGAVLQVSIVIFRIQDLFKYIIENILNKSTTFSTRTYIWDFAIEMIKKHPIQGLGNPSSFGISGWYYDIWSGYLFMHNEFLEWFVNGGFFAFISFVMFIVWPTYVMFKNRKRIEVSALSLGVLASIIMMISEGLTPRAPFIILIMLCYHVKYLKEKNNTVRCCEIQQIEYSAL